MKDVFMIIEDTPSGKTFQKFYDENMEFIGARDIDDKLLTSFYYSSLKNSNIGAITILLLTSSALLLGALFIIWTKRLYTCEFYK